MKNSLKIEILILGIVISFTVKKYTQKARPYIAQLGYKRIRI